MKYLVIGASGTGGCIGGFLAKAGKDVTLITLQKFSFVSPMAALGASYDIPSAAVQKEGDFRSMFAALIQEIKALSDAMQVSLPENIVEINLKIMDDLIPTATASMQRDIKNGKQSEVDGLVYQVVRLGEQYHVPVPVYTKLADKLKQML